ncbi:hypothetical protein [Streptomyces europaeiscabiei]|uniref:hypothetical protein n=1 Tax=Streptomyces europaeiscabiei TaxID=146819 RepID=UPI0038F70E42
MSTLTGPRTCGKRIPLAKDLMVHAYAEGRGVGGMVRGSLLCEVAEHDDDQHWGIARELAEPHGGAVWATWQDREAPRCLTRKDCPQTGTGAEGACALFVGHPGVCSHFLDQALRADPGRVERIDAALAILATFDRHEAHTVQTAAHDAALLAWDELRARRLWVSMPGCDQAAVHRLVSRTASVRTRDPHAVAEFAGEAAEVTSLWQPSATGRLPHGESATSQLKILEGLTPEWQAVVLGSQRPPKSWSPHASTLRTPLAEALDDACQQAAAGQEPSPALDSWAAAWDHKEDRVRGARVAERLTQLPYGWRVDVMRRIGSGTESLAAVSDAMMAINILRAFGLQLAWNSGQQARSLPSSG